MKKFGFTLAEVLITLGIIGVVAAMTIPVLQDRVQEKVLLSKLKVSYNILSNAYKMAMEENGGDASGWDIGQKSSKDGASKLYNKFAPHIKQLQSCDTAKGQKCFAENYYDLFGTKPVSNDENIDFRDTWGKGILLNGVSIAFYSSGNRCLAYDSFLGYSECGTVIVDLNGQTMPNRFGIDVFEFVITAEKGIQPKYGDDKDTYGAKCKYKDKGQNGRTCTWYALKYNSMDYRRKDISQYYIRK